VDDQSATPLEDDRRRLWDRRSPQPRRGSHDRRTRDRRRAPGEAEEERRAGRERRHSDRRRNLERRSPEDRRRPVRWRETPVPYTTEQLADLRSLFAAPGPVRCPACGNRVALGWAVHTAAERSRRVMCLGCGRGAIIPDAGPARILLVGDNDALRDIVQAALSRAGHDVVEAADGEVGLVAYDTVPADLVLLDLESPGRMEAAEFARGLREAYPEARLIAMVPRSSRGDRDPSAEARAIRVRRTIHLPLSREELLRTVDEARLQATEGGDDR
jgi:CheY-like chemotaxis protein